MKISFKKTIDTESTIDYTLKDQTDIPDNQKLVFELKGALDFSETKELKRKFTQDQTGVDFVEKVFHSVVKDIKNLFYDDGVPIVLERSELDPEKWSDECLNLFSGPNFKYLDELAIYVYKNLLETTEEDTKNL